jgi:hypothetical protein
MRRIFTAAALAGAAVFFLSAPARAQQAEDDPYGKRGAVLYLQGGGFSALRDVTEGGVGFDTGYSFGGGVGYQFTRYLALRGNFTFTRAELAGPDANGGAPAPGSPFERGQEVNKYFYGADLQARYPTGIGLAPYLVLGGGAVTVDSSTFDSFTQPAGKFGAGLSYILPHTGASVFAEWTGWVYKWDQQVPLEANGTNADRTQFDSTWSGGLRFVF